MNQNTKCPFCGKELESDEREVIEVDGVLCHQVCYDNALFSIEED